MELSATEKLQDFFPKAPKNCKTEAQSFFSCFTAGSVKSSKDDKDAGFNGLRSCMNEKKAYDSCMFGWEKKFSPKRYRVQDEYRTPSDAVPSVIAAK